MAHQRERETSDGADNHSDDETECSCLDCGYRLRYKIPDQIGTRRLMHMESLQEIFKAHAGATTLLTLPLRVKVLTSKEEALKECESWRDWAWIMSSAYTSMMNEICYIHVLSREWNDTHVKIGRSIRPIPEAVTMFSQEFGAKAELIRELATILTPTTAVINMVLRTDVVEQIELDLIAKAAADLVEFCDNEALTALDCIQEFTTYAPELIPWKSVRMILRYLCLIAGKDPQIHLKGSICFCRSCIEARYPHILVLKEAREDPRKRAENTPGLLIDCCNTVFTTVWSFLGHHDQQHRSKTNNGEGVLKAETDNNDKQIGTTSGNQIENASSSIAAPENTESAQESTKHLPDTYYDWLEATRTTRASQWSDDDISSGTKKCKRKRHQTVSTMPQLDPEIDTPESGQAPHKCIFNNRAHYDTLRILIPLPGDKHRKGTLTWNAFCTMMQAEPLLFKITEHHGVSYTFKQIFPEDSQIQPVAVTFHKPHTKQILERHVVRNMGQHLGKCLKCEAEDFVFQE